MNGEKLVGLVVSALDNSVKRAVLRRMSQLEERFGLTPNQVWVLDYVTAHAKTEDVFQRDIEARFNIRRSTATGILQLMEKNGLITREAIESDARMKKIALTEKGRELTETANSLKGSLESELLAGVSDEDWSCFLRVCDIVGVNARSIN